jgi:hypothetical protein
MVRPVYSRMQSMGGNPDRVVTVICTLLTVGMTCIAVSGCSSVPAPQADSTPPDVTMDVYGIPLPPPNRAHDETVDVTVQCCDISRKPPLQRRIDLVAGGMDPQGVRRTTIAIHLVVACTHDFHTEDIIAGQNEDPQPSPSASVTTPANAPSSRLAQGSFRLQDHTSDQCPNLSESPAGTVGGVTGLVGVGRGLRVRASRVRSRPRLSGSRIRVG